MLVTIHVDHNKHSIRDAVNINTEMSEIQSVLDEIKKCRKHAKDGICYFFFRIDAVITMCIITPAQLCCHIAIFF